MNTSKFKYVVGEAKENEFVTSDYFVISMNIPQIHSIRNFYGLRVISNQVRSGS